MSTALAGKVGRKPREARPPLTPDQRQRGLWDLNCGLAKTKRQLAHAEQMATCDDGVITPNDNIVRLRREREQLERRIEELTLDRKYWEL